jgi:catalase
MKQMNETHEASRLRVRNRIVWPDDRETVDLGTIALTSVVPDSDAAEKAPAFDPTRLPDGIELSDDPLPAVRSTGCMLSRVHRQGS